MKTIAGFALAGVLLIVAYNALAAPHALTTFFCKSIEPVEAFIEAPTALEARRVLHEAERAGECLVFVAAPNGPIKVLPIPIGEDLGPRIDGMTGETVHIYTAAGVVDGTIYFVSGPRLTFDDEEQIEGDEV